MKFHFMDNLPKGKSFNMVPSRIIILLIFVLTKSNKGARILGVYPTPSISHQVIFRPLTDELVKRGHDVTVITTDPVYTKGQAPKNLREIDVHDISYGIWRESLSKFGTGDRKDAIKQGHTFMEKFTKIIEAQLLSPEVQALINNKNETFDLILVELCTRPALVFSHLFKAPVIYVSSLGGMFETYEIVGAPVHPLLYALPLRHKLMDLTMWDKITELYNNYHFYYIYEQNIKLEDAMLRRIVGKDMPSVAELTKNIQLIILNIHPLWDDNRPVPPNVIYIGGVHEKPEKKLPQDLKSYLDSSKHGVIYFSLGTNVVPSALPPEKIQIFLKVFSKLPYDVLWKNDKEELPGRPSNVRLEKWLPQSDMLKHPKIKLFITQGGLQSTDEAIAAGVPLVAIPMLGDQWYNSERYVQFKIGTKVDLKTLTEDIFKDALETVLGDDSYRQRIRKLREVLSDQPQRPVERGVWWIEHVLQHGGEHLKSPAANMSWTEYYEIQLVSVLFVVFLTAVLLVAFIVRALWRRVCNTTVKVKKS